MFSSQPTSPTNRSTLPHSFHSNRCHPERSEGSAFRLPPLCALSVSAFSFPDVSSFNFKLSTVSYLPLSPFPATLTDDRQPTENPAALRLVVATLTSRFNHNPFVCHSYKKHPGWDSQPLSIARFSRYGSCLPSFRFHRSRITGRGPRVPNNESPVTGSTLCLPRVTSHQSKITKSCRICTYEKRAPNPFRIRTSKTQHLKPFRMNTYEKTRGGPHPQADVFIFPLLYTRLSQARPKRATKGSEDSLPFTGHGSRVTAPKIHESPIASHRISPCYTPARLRKRLSQFLARTSRRQPIS